MTRAEQDAILAPVVLAYARMHRDMGYGWPGCSVLAHRVDSFRAALLLDSKRLDDLIAQGAHKQPWQSPTDAERMARA